MSVSLRVTGAWAELTDDGAVAIPATPQAGDRMFLFARWKDFSVTATVANWTELIEFADGAVTAGNGTGSVKVGCWYRDWQSGDTNPTIDFSAAVENASVVIMVMQKGADDVWTTPVARTQAMTNWTTTSQIVAASATVAVPSGGVVMGLIGIRDDSATMTRPSTGIDDSAAAVTWNGDYVESPATHHSTTTGFDGASDLGYRLVSVGATATLRMTGTISAAETGAALWVVQGTIIVVTPSPASLTLTTLAPTLATSVVPATATLAITSFAPTLKTSVIPASVSLTISTFAPQLKSSVIPATVNLTITAFSPTLKTIVTPETLSLSLATFAPSLVTAVVPDSVSLTITTTAPTLLSAVTPATLSLTITTFEPTIYPIPPPNIVWLDPGGDAVQAIGYFNTVLQDGSGVTFDATQQVVGVGSYKFNSGASLAPAVKVAKVLGVPLPTSASRRVSCYWRYDSVPDVSLIAPQFPLDSSAYSGGGLADQHNLNNDDAQYATATPAQNAGQGTVYGLFGFCAEDFVGSSGFTGLLVGAIIDSVKIVYERSYDTQSSIGISRVKYMVDGDEGPDHDNTDQPLTDTVVEVDVTADRAWTWQELLDGVFEVIVEARRGNTSTPHTQSWDYVRVEVTYHPAVTIMAAALVGGGQGFKIAVTPHGDGVVLRFTDGAGMGYDGITELLPDTQHRISFSYDFPDVDELDIKLYINGIEELSIVDADTVTSNASALNVLQYGWLVSPGVDHVCWFDQFYIDEGDDLSDCGNKLMTAKLPASTNENEWDTVGTGAVNERPLSITNYVAQTSAFTPERQTYTLQTAATGDVDISGETLIGHMGWAWAKVQFDDFWDLYLVVNGVDIDRSAELSPTTSLLRYPVNSTSYPSDAAGIGMAGSNEAPNTFMYECGAIVAYEGPIVPSDLLDFQLLAEDSTTDASDDMGGTPPESYVLRSEITETTDSVVTTTISSSDEEGGSPQQQVIIESQGGDDRGITNLSPGNEVTTSTLVTGADTNVELRRVDQTLAE